MTHEKNKSHRIGYKIRKKWNSVILYTQSKKNDKFFPCLRCWEMLIDQRLPRNVIHTDTQFGIVHEEPTLRQIGQDTQYKFVQRSP